MLLMADAPLVCEVAKLRIASVAVRSGETPLLLENCIANGYCRGVTPLLLVRYIMNGYRLPKKRRKL